MPLFIAPVLSFLRSVFLEISDLLQIARLISLLSKYLNRPA